MTSSSEDISPPILYHYTTQQGLLGILHSRHIWATKIQLMNDAAEFRTAIDAVCDELRSRAVARESDQELTRIDNLFKELDDLQATSVFVLSLTEEGDQLSQWRAYAGRHSGFALGFDVKKICAIASDHQFVLDRCIYDSLSQHLLVLTAVDAAMASLDHSDAMSRRRCREFRRTMLQMAPIVKHRAFAEEKEWRLFTSAQKITAPNVDFRSGPSTIIPYYKLPIEATDGTTALTSVIVGPTPHPELALESVYAMAERRGITGLTVETSEIPLRTW